jgi:hypothetical protein
LQAQDYAGATWAIGLRSQNVTNADAKRAFTEGKIFRTHVMRPTWHFVISEDLRWLLKLTAPRVHAFNAYRYRQFEVDDTIFKCSHEVFIKALQGNNHLIRSELAEALEPESITAKGLRLAHITISTSRFIAMVLPSTHSKQSPFCANFRKTAHNFLRESNSSFPRLTTRVMGHRLFCSAEK